MALWSLLMVLASLAYLPSEARWHEVFKQSPENSTLATNKITGMSSFEASEEMIRQVERAWSTGWWTKDSTAGLRSPDGCGGSTTTEIGMSIHRWRSMNPNKDAFCHFQNFAGWLRGAGKVTDYTSYGKGAWQSSMTSSEICTYLGQSRGPERSITYDAGTITWDHLDHCVDLIDDPYCFSLGWLKNQHPKQHLMRNYTAWTEVGKEECAKIQDEFKFMDSEVTVGKHIFSTPVYFKGAWCALYGSCPPITVRTHKEHVYTKCLLGNAAQEMAYCYYKGCVLPGNRIGHGTECGYTF